MSLKVSILVLCTSGFVMGQESLAKEQNPSSVAATSVEIEVQQEVKSKNAAVPKKMKISSEKIMLKPVHGAGVALSYKDLPEHKAVKLSFTVHFVGPWDGSGFEQWGPDRFICETESGMKLLDATFNNCHLVWTDNVWQSYPEPHHVMQKNDKELGRFLHYGGSGAKRVASLGHGFNKLKSVDSTYTFTFYYKHSGAEANLKFFTDWVEDNSSSTYWLENVRLGTLAELPPVDEQREEQAWLRFFGSDAERAQREWASYFALHPERFVMRVERLLKTDKSRVDTLIKRLGEGKTPVMGLQREVVLDPKMGDAAKVYERILSLRELALTRGLFDTAAGKFWRKESDDPQTVAIVKALAARGENSRVLKMSEMRLSSYLRMIGSKKALALAGKLDDGLGDLEGN